LGIYPGLKATKGAEGIMLNRPRAVPAGNSEPVLEYFTKWLSGRTLHLFATGVAGKVHLLIFHLFSPQARIRAAGI